MTGPEAVRPGVVGSLWSWTTLLLPNQRRYNGGAKNGLGWVAEVL